MAKEIKANNKNKQGDFSFDGLLFKKDTKVSYKLDSTEEEKLVHIDEIFFSHRQQHIFFKEKIDEDYSEVTFLINNYRTSEEQFRLFEELMK